MDTNQKRELLKKLKEREKIEADRNIDRFIPSPVQKAFLLSRAKTRIVEGANRSGKTEVCAVDTIIQNTGRIPDIIKDSYPKEYIRAGRYWISSRSFGASRDVAKPKVERYLPKLLVDRFNKADYIYYLKDGSQIGFKSMDAGMIAYSGDSRLQVWMDEEHSKDVFKEAYMRTIDCSGRIVMSFTPVDGLTWAYNDLYKKAKYRYFTRNKHGIKEETGKIHTAEEIELLKDRELHVRENTDNTADPNIEVFQMTMYDNKYIPSVQVQNAERECADDMALYQARILGIFAKITGNCVYPTELIIEGKAKCPMFFERGDIEDRKFIQKTNGRLIVFKKRNAGRQYIVAADPSEGLDTGDFACAQVLDHHTCEQVAIWHGKAHPEEFTRILIDIGRYYNNALLAPERNFHGFGIVDRIRDQRYPRLFCNYEKDLKTTSSHQGAKKYGWDTNSRSKPLMVQELGRFIRERHVKINDPNTWDELMTFNYLGHGKTGAIKGCFDDRAIALMIAVQVFIERRPLRHNFNTDKSPQRKVDKYTGY